MLLRPSGSLRITRPGTIIDGQDIKGSVTVLADNVTIRRSRITSDSEYPIRVSGNDNLGLRVEDTEIVGLSDDVTSGIAFANYTALRVDVHGTTDGLKAEDHVVIKDSYIHNLRAYQGSHNDGVQNTGGSYVTLTHNTILVNKTSVSCILIGSDSEHLPSDVTISNNLLNGGGFSVYLDPRGRNRRVIGNHFGLGYQYGVARIDGEYSWRRNVWDRTGRRVLIPR